jgi:GNAT superfamily N-acetyltransferase
VRLLFGTGAWQRRGIWSAASFTEEGHVSFGECGDTRATQPGGQTPLFHVPKSDGRFHRSAAAGFHLSQYAIQGHPVEQLPVDDHRVDLRCVRDRLERSPFPQEGRRNVRAVLDEFRLQGLGSLLVERIDHRFRVCGDAVFGDRLHELLLVGTRGQNAEHVLFALLFGVGASATLTVFVTWPANMRICFLDSSAIAK